MLNVNQKRQRASVMVSMDDEHLFIDNNISEGAIKNLLLGRKDVAGLNGAPFTQNSVPPRAFMLKHRIAQGPLHRSA